MSLQLTKDQRYTAYCIMLAEAETNLNTYLHGGFCWMTMKIFDINDNEKTFDNGDFLWSANVDYFPELAAKKPVWITARGQGWFDGYQPGWEMRKSLLKQCIEETADF